MAQTTQNILAHCKWLCSSLLLFWAIVATAQSFDPGIRQVEHLVECNLCVFEDLIVLVHNVFAMAFTFAIFIAGIGFAYAGMLVATGGSNPKQLNTARALLTKVLVGITVTMFSFWVVNAIMHTLAPTIVPVWSIFEIDIRGLFR